MVSFERVIHLGTLLAVLPECGKVVEELYEFQRETENRICRSAFRKRIEHYAEKKLEEMIPAGAAAGRSTKTAIWRWMRKINSYKLKGWKIPPKKIIKKT